MTVIFSVMGRKGGQTKTTIATNLGAMCALSGLQTLVIDADGQGNASDAMGVEKHDAFYQLIIEGKRWDDVISDVPVSFPGRAAPIWVLSASDAQREVEIHANTPQLMYERFSQLRGIYDVVIVDTPPSITNVHAGCYYSSDYVLLPTLCETDGAKSLLSMFKYLEEARRAGGEAFPVATLLGVVPNRWEKSEVTRETYGYIRGICAPYCEVFDPIYNSVAWKEARRTNKSIFAVKGPLFKSWSKEARFARAQFQIVGDRVLEIAYKNREVTTA